MYSVQQLWAIRVSDAQARAYEVAAKIHWDGVYLRDDIGWRAIAREQNS